MRLDKKIKEKIKVLYYKIYNFFLSKKFKSLNGVIKKPHELIGTQYIAIGKNTEIEQDIILTAWDKYGRQNFQPQIIIGDNCSIGEHCHITAVQSVQIGNGVLTGRNVYISDNNHGDASLSQANIPPKQRPLHIKGPVSIRDNVWIGERVCILSGVTIGKGSIIAANAVVTHDIPEYCIAGGVPAKVIRLMK
jgi:acetyltransferase-like isoleucine patch superfamily enzyme